LADVRSQQIKEAVGAALATNKIKSVKNETESRHSLPSSATSNAAKYLEPLASPFPY
jgi:hypothetical protein